MPANYLRFIINGQPVELTILEEIPIAINYKLEDTEDFQQKTSDTAFDVTVPATLDNDQLSNTFHDPAIEDMTSGEVFKKPRPCVIEANGYEHLIGKAFLKQATHDSAPLGYTYDCYGGNGAWMIDLKDSTLYDFLQHISYDFGLQPIVDSWGFDGTSEALPYVFAPVRYANPFSQGHAYYISGTQPLIDDFNISIDYMRPSISAYYLIYWAFKSLGYRVQSAFMESPYFRRMVMPWVWGNYLYSDGTDRDQMKFMAASAETVKLQSTGPNFLDFVDLKVSNDQVSPNYDNASLLGGPGNYTYSSITKEAAWTYLPRFSSFGQLNANFNLQVPYDAQVSGGSSTAAPTIIFDVRWYKNGTLIQPASRIVDITTSSIGTSRKQGMYEQDLSVDVSPGDVVSVKFYLILYSAPLGNAILNTSVASFSLHDTRIVYGSAISFATFTNLKKFKFLDFLRGIVDDFNLTVYTDPVSKVVHMEPTHPYSLTSNAAVKTGGFFNGDYLDWNQKQDVSKVSTLNLYAEGERELTFKFRDDSSDGMIKKLQDRNAVTLGAGKYILPERFQAGKKDIENRFFSPVMHTRVSQWSAITGTAPQMIVMVPENISNTSASEAENTFNPKLAYYKGQNSAFGWMFHDSIEYAYPEMFAVNYQPGGESDPVLSYSDENINGVIAKGLLSRFYWQRLAIMRNGQYYSTFMKLKNIDVANRQHREHKIVRGQRWELVEIKGYKPLTDETTEVSMRKWVPVGTAERDNTFPSTASVAGTVSASQYDTKYVPLLCLISDI